MNIKSTRDAFIHYQKSPAGRIRYQQAISNLEAMHNLSKELKVLDAAGGNGLITEYLLKNNHKVTLYDSDPQMLAEAKARIRPKRLLDRCKMVKGSLDCLGEKFPQSSFDLILCHHVLEYTGDVFGILKSMFDLTIPGGTLSLITINPVSEVIRAVLFQHDSKLAQSKLNDLSYDARWFGKATLYNRNQLETWAQNAGWAFCDFRGIFDSFIVPTSFLAALVNCCLLSILTSVN